MSVKVESLSNPSEELWVVSFGTRRVQFRNEHSARGFATKLKERIEAPHKYTFCRYGHREYEMKMSAK